jgi:uncharacterized protein
MPSLVDRLNNLGLKKGTEITPPVQKSSNLPLCEVLHGKILQNQFGSVVVVEKLFPYGYQHGDILFIDSVNDDAIHKAAKVSGATNPLHDLIFLDTETTGLAGGTGTLAFLIGFARFEEDGLRLIQYVVEEPAEEPAMLLEFSNAVEKTKGVVSYNGKAFDLPLLRSRFILNRLPQPFETWGHLDLLHLSRRIWRQRLESRTLKDLEQEILHIPRSEDEVPGWMIPEIYFNFLRSGDATQIANVVYHNAMDIVSLAALYISITRYLDEDLFSGKIHPMDVFAIGQIYENIGDFEKSRWIYEYCEGFEKYPANTKIELNARLANLYKKDKVWNKALPLWKSNSENEDFPSCIELAKYYEHIQRDAAEALNWTKKAEVCINQLKLPQYKKKSLIKEIGLRKTRLEKRIQDVQSKK